MGGVKIVISPLSPSYVQYISRLVMPGTEVRNVTIIPRLQQKRCVGQSWEMGKYR